MKKKNLMAKSIVLILSTIITIGNVFSAVDYSNYKVEKSTVIAISHYLNSNSTKSEEGSVVEVSKILAKDEAILKFSQMIVELCQDPSHFNFPVKDIDESECTQEKVIDRVQSDLAYTILNNFPEEAKADQVESYLNNFLNTYLEKMRAVIEAFNSWM